MADYYIVLAHKGEGWIGGLFTSLADATAYVSTTPKWATEIMKVTLDSHVGQSMNVHLATEKPARAGTAYPGSIVQGVSP
jgi:hypothetical protein